MQPALRPFVHTLEHYRTVRNGSHLCCAYFIYLFLLAFNVSFIFIMNLLFPDFNFMSNNIAGSSRMILHRTFFILFSARKSVITISSNGSEFFKVNFDRQSDLRSLISWMVYTPSWNRSFVISSPNVVTYTSKNPCFPHLNIDNNGRWLICGRKLLPGKNLWKIIARTFYSI